MTVRSLVVTAVLMSAFGCCEVRSFVRVSVLPRQFSRQEHLEQQYRTAVSAARDRLLTFGGVGAAEPPKGRPTPTIMMARGSTFRSNTESKRQARVSQLVTQELAKILRLGHGIKTNDRIDDEMRCRIAVVDVDMSPDLRAAKVFISVYGDVLEKREAYAWCVKNTKAIRRALCAELKGMKRVPELFFKDTDIGAAVDLMALIDRVSGDKESEEVVLRDGGEEEIEGFEGLTEEDFFTFNFDDDDTDVGFDLDEEERDGELE